MSVWIEIERRFADPTYAPDWGAGPDRPAWRGKALGQPQAFREWVAAQLDELAARVRAERLQEIEAEITPELIAAMAKGIADGMPALKARVEGIRMAKPGASINDIAEIERLQEIREATNWQGGAGRPRSGVDTSSPAARAAWDIWRIRKVLFPRFWPEEAEKGWRRDRLDVAKIAAARHKGATAEAAHSWYKNQRLAHR